MTDERATISSSRLSAADVVRHSFGVVKRGFDPAEVRSFLDLVAKELQGIEGREFDLRRQIAEAEERAKHPILDEATLTAALGQSSAQVLRNAYEEAAKITERAEQSAAQLLRNAQLQAADLEVQTESTVGGRIAEAELLAASLEQTSRTLAQKTLESASADGETLIAHAREQGRAMVEQAQEARRRVLEDMDRRRRRMHVQIEQLRAARDELAGAIVAVRSSVDRITDELAHSDEDARLAAVEVARRQPTLEGLSDAEVAALAGDEPDDTSPLVDELFAKIRASVEEGDETEAAEIAATEAAELAELSVVPSVSELPTLEQPVIRSSSDTAFLADRDAAVAEGVMNLTKRVKRALQDDQNTMLERLRSGKATPQQVLGSEVEQRTAYVESTSDVLSAISSAGAAFASRPGTSTVVLDASLSLRLAEHMSATIVTLLRRHLEAAGVELTPESLGAAFKEWRGPRVEGLVVDVALSAFASGQLAASQAVGSGQLTWVAAGGEEACAECVANGSAGPVLPGNEFVSGHRHPPVHAGCRCAITSTSV